MSPEKQRIAIAKACGWVWYRHPVASSFTNPHYRFLALPASQEFMQSPEWMVRSDETEKPCAMEYMAREFHVPDYLNDLNAMNDAPHNLSLLQYNDYGTCLYNVVARDNSKNVTSYGVFDATAAQRAEAFLRTLNLWEEE